MRTISSTLLVLGLSMGTANAAEHALCKFNDRTLSFKGSIAEQMQCLLRAVMPQGAGSRPQAIPAFLSSRVGKPVAITAAQLNRYLQAKGIAHTSIGGSPSDPVSTAKGRDGVERPAFYFIIHDTSAPKYPKAEGFPGNINDKSWRANRVGPGYWIPPSEKVNAIVSRTGDSHTFIDFKDRRPRVGIKLEMNSYAPHSKGRFVHVENIQPRLEPSGSWAHIAPDPGFTEPQLERLALLYIAASVRAGRWIMPAYHFNIDHKIAPGVHANDDPQNFDLAQWVQKIETLTQAISSNRRAAADDTGSPVTRASCALGPFTAVLNRGTEARVRLPAEGKLFGEGHYVTTEDRSFSNGRYPKPMVPQPPGYPPPVQCNEQIDAHLDRSLVLYRRYDASMTKARLFPDKWALWWTPEEGGRCGQGSVGDHQLRELTPEMEMWFFTMNWARGHRPPRGSRFLISANGRHVVAVAGYETGPGDARKLGGITREIHGWLGTDNDSEMRVGYLEDQDAPVGPVRCINR